jgi:hypothetical protein
MSFKGQSVKLALIVHEAHLKSSINSKKMSAFHSPLAMLAPKIKGDNRLDSP